MNVSRILFPTDFSSCGDEALELATSLARDSGATLVIVHVEELPASYGAGHMYYGPAEPTTAQLRQMLHEVVPSDREVKCEYHLLTGDSVRTLVDFADAQKVDLIVMGTHGRTGLFHVLMGSVAEKVVRHATCPVVTVKHPRHPSVERKT